MRPASVGGLLIVAACILLVVTGIMAAGGAAVSVAGQSPGGIVVTIALLLLACGAIVLSASGPRPLDGRVVRLGLALLAIGIVAILTTSNVSVSSMLILVFLGGGAVAGLGAMLTALGLLLTSGRPRQVAIAFLGGLLLVIVAGALNNSAIESGGAPVGAFRILLLGLVAAGGAVMVAALAGVGVLGWRSGRTGRDAPG